jgi:hypothetical protein
MSKQKPKVNKELDGFELSVNAFGEIKSTMQIDKLNEFLDKTVIDKKLKDRDDLDVIRDPKQEK